VTVDEKDTQLEQFKKLAESEAEALRQRIPELDEIEGSDSEHVDANAKLNVELP